MLAVGSFCSVRSRHHASICEITSFCLNHACISASRAASEFDAGTLGRSVGLFSQFTTVRVIGAAVAKATAWTCAPTATEQTVPIQSGIDARIMGSSRVGDPDGVGI